MPIVKQSGITYNFFESLVWLNLVLTPFSRAISEHPTLSTLNQRWMSKIFLNIHRWFNIFNIIPHCADDDSMEPKRYSCDFVFQ